MFIDEKTQVQIHANLEESVIHSTMRPCDLVPVFLNVIRDTAEYAQMVANNSIPEVVTDAGANDYDERWENEEMIYFLNETLFDILNSYAPDGYYFGSHEGDASDYGFWRDYEL